MKKILGLALSGAMALGMAAATGTSAQASETSARERQEKQSSYRYRVHTKVWPYSWGRYRGGVKVRVYRNSYDGRVPVPYIRVCLQKRTPYRYRTIECERTNRWGGADFRMVDRVHWYRGDRARGLRRASGKNFSTWYRVFVPPSYRNYGHVSDPFRLWDRWGWDGDYGDDYDDGGDYDGDYERGWRRASGNR
ncbi:hypothetical protein ABGB12_21570 [Actinocorallia sp. B10E7]|uniref:hypothetical protein n=1 Tax=Actinocorallia sp. B10E7 TaxID=3153558 RepID=UPI00325D72C0